MQNSQASSGFFSVEYVEELCWLYPSMCLEFSPGIPEAQLPSTARKICCMPGNFGRKVAGNTPGLPGNFARKLAGNTPCMPGNFALLAGKFAWKLAGNTPCMPGNFARLSGKFCSQYPWHARTFARSHIARKFACKIKSRVKKKGPCCVVCILTLQGGIIFRGQYVTEESNSGALIKDLMSLILGSS